MIWEPSTAEVVHLEVKRVNDSDDRLAPGVGKTLLSRYIHCLNTCICSN